MSCGLMTRNLSRGLLNMTSSSMTWRNYVTRKKMNVVEMREEVMRICGASKIYSDEVGTDRNELKSLLKENQKDLEERSIGDSNCDVIIPLSDPLFREKYFNTKRAIRIGQLLEDLDGFAVLIAYKHNALSNSKQGRSPYVIVTAMVDELLLHKREISPYYDVTMQGHVSWVGRSSLEVSMNMRQVTSQQDDDDDDVFLETQFLMVARHPTAEKAAVVHPLKISTNEAEMKLLEEGNERKLLRIETSKQSLFSSAPNSDEMKLIHQMFLSTVKPGSQSFNSRFLPPNCVWMSSTKLKNAVVCFPQFRNVYNKIFGGFIMRMAFELAWSNAVMFSKSRPIPKAIDDIHFHSPVKIGSLILMSSQICVVEGWYYLVRVRAEAVDPQTHQSVTSNVFHFTFTSDQQINKVLPETYGESILYLDGLRRLQKQISIFENQ